MKMAGVHSVVCLLLTLIVPRTARPSDVKQALYHKQTAMQGLLLDVNTLFQVSVRSMKHCGAKCGRVDGCRSYTYTAEQPSSCRGYNVTTASPKANSTVPAPGAETFDIADWLTKPCSADGECYQADHSECFKGECLCTPGYFYSKGTKNCRVDCRKVDLAMSFVKYRMSFLRTGTHVDGSNHGSGLSFCQDYCMYNTTTACKSLGFVRSGLPLDGKTCPLTSQTALSVRPDVSYERDNSSYDHYQRICV